MRLAHLLRAIYSDVWLVTPEKHHQIQELVKLKLTMARQDFQARDREIEISGEKVLLDSMSIEDGVARIPFAGVMVKGAGSFEKWAGAIAHADIEADVQEALASKEVKAIFFDVDSPGGTAAGSFELADLVAYASKRKETMAWVEGQCCSAAFLALSGCDMIYGSKTSEVGAVECYLALLDSSAAYAAQGLKVDVIANTGGTHVGAGMPGTSLSEDQRAEFQHSVDYLYGLYVNHLEKVRPDVPKSAMDGRTFLGKEAVKVKMLDACTTKAQALSDLRSWAGLD